MLPGRYYDPDSKHYGSKGMMAETARPRPADGVRGKDLGSEYMFYDEDGDQHHILNGTAREIFLLCDGTRTEDEVVRELLPQFEVDEVTLRRDVSDIIEDLVKLKLLTVA